LNFRNSSKVYVNHELSMRKLQIAGRLSVYRHCSIYYISFDIAARGIRPALSSGRLGPSKIPGRPNSHGRLSLNLYTELHRAPNEAQQNVNGRGCPRPKKKKFGELWISVTMEFIYGCLE
jgi:hypothetical protein